MKIKVGDYVKEVALLEHGYKFSHYYGSCEVYEKDGEFIFVDKDNKVTIVLKPKQPC